MSAAVMAERTLHGRNTIAPRAVRGVVSAVTADALEVTASDVSVDVTDGYGSITVVAKTAVRVTPLGVETRSAGTLVERLASAQSTIRQRVLDLTGSTVERVDLRVTSADIRTRKRVS
ncbi:hypothetical protein [Marisediminicola sp. LYQ85]|uniref:hypothetical protein n=1 Tax=Marisediminicola sp. LYQ85 TaxID=3391062 RepID=UPI003982DA74